MGKFEDGIKKALLAGVGVAAITAEKSKVIIDELVKKGEVTVEEGKKMKEELRQKKEAEEAAAREAAEAEKINIEFPEEEAADEEVRAVTDEALADEEAAEEEAADEETADEEAAESVGEKVKKAAGDVAGNAKDFAKMLKDLTREEAANLKNALEDFLK
ncbi:MAG: hypothetical protein IJJ52_03000 [Lachnospiraceae bacterium]|nr:hypothetical protein [Lachnospiraceae bacterium]